MLGLRCFGAFVLLLGACGPRVDVLGDDADDAADTTGANADADGTGGGGGLPPPTTTTPSTVTTANPATSSDPDPTDGNDSSHDTEYPVDPSCDEGDESYSHYDSGGGLGSESGSGGAENTSVGMGGDIPLGTTIFVIQTGGIEGGEYVEISDVVVTTPPIPGPSGVDAVIFVQEPQGGSNSGIQLRIEYADPDIDALLPGDRITVRGHFIERYVFASLLVEDSNADIDVGTPGPLPDPVIVSPAMVSAGGELAEELESVLVEVHEVSIVDPMICPGEVEVEATLRLDDRYLAAVGESIPAPPTGIYDSVRGPLIYTFNGFEVAPRSLEDIAF